MRKYKGTLGFLALFYLTLAVGIVFQTPTFNFVLVVGLVIAQILQKTLFGWRHFPSDKAVIHEGLSESEIYFRGAYIPTNMKAKKEKRFLESVYETQGPTAAKIFIGLMLVLFFVVGRHMPGHQWSASDIFNVLAIVSIVPVASFSQYLIPLFFSALAFLSTRELGSNYFFLASYGVSFCLTCAAHGFKQREIFLSEREGPALRNGATLRNAFLASLVLMSIYTALNLILPDHTPLKSQATFKMAEKLNGIAARPRRFLSGQSPHDLNQVGKRMISQGGVKSAGDPKGGAGQIPKSDQRVSSQIPTELPKFNDAEEKKDEVAKKGSGDAGVAGSAKGEFVEGQGPAESSAKSNAATESSGERSNPEATQTVPTPTPKLFSEAMLMALVTLFKFAAAFGILWFVFWFFARKPNSVKAIKKRPKIPKNMKAELIEEMRKVMGVRIQNRDAIIRGYQLFLKIMAAAQAPKEDYLPPGDYAAKLKRIWPKFDNSFEIITDVFSDAFYGNLSISDPKIREYESALNQVMNSIVKHS